MLEEPKNPSQNNKIIDTCTCICMYVYMYINTTCTCNYWYSPWPKCYLVGVWYC